PEECELVAKAYQMAEKVNDNIPPIVENISVLQQSLNMANVLIELGLDATTIAATLVIMPVQHQALTHAQITRQLGSTVAKLVDSVGTMVAIDSLHHAGNKQQDMAHMDKLRKMLLAMVDDPRGILVKLAEHLCLLRIAKYFPSDKQVQIAEQAADIYAPLANRLGIGQLKWEMEDLALRFRDPNTYKYIAKLLDEKRLDREDYIQEVIRELKEALAQDGIEADVQGRVKHIYSIWRKMQRKKVDYDEIYDVRAVRILVPEVRDCYAALGTVHRLWRHIPKEFDDYIAMAKENGYQSLHTAVIGPKGKAVEVQIRTHQMHQDSELGVASHWRYKEGVRHDPRYEDKIAWLRQLIDWQEQVADADELVNELREKVYEDRVYVLTPGGEVVDMQRGATPLDFAYHVHTTIGHRCRGAKVNGRIVPLTYQLSTGERVEILTGGEPNPSRDWLNPDLGYINTPRARSKVRAWFREQNRDQNLAAGRALMEKELHRMGIESLDYKALAPKFNFDDADEIWVALGRGDLRPIQVINLARETLVLPKIETEEMPPTQTESYKPSYSADTLVVQGVEHLLTHMAGCCRPIPGDRIIGYVTQGKGIAVHRRECNNIIHIQETRPERLVEVSWGVEGQQKYPVTIEVVADDRSNLLRDITQIFANERSSILALNCTVRGESAYITLTVEVMGLERLGKTLERIQQLPHVMEVRRKRVA
ncbi:MAG: GTP diphosphokinase, partial [Gammaproteobacteria bacterium]